MLILSAAIADTAAVVAATTTSQNQSGLLDAIIIMLAGVLSISTLLGFYFVNIVSNLCKEISELFAALAKATSDGKISPTEIVEIKNEISDIKTTILEKLRKK